MMTTRSLLLLLALGTAAACGNSTGTAHFTWDLTQGGAAVACARGDYVQSESDRGGTTIVDQFDCSSMAGFIDLDSGTWDITVRLFDVTNAQLSDTVTLTNQVIRSGVTLELGNFEFAF